MPNAIYMLKADHKSIRRLLNTLNAEEGSSAAAAKRRDEIVRDLEREVKMHAQVEEEVFYPAFKAAAERRKTADVDLFYEAAEEHHIVDMVLPTLKTANSKSKEFQAKAKVIKELLEHHIKEEEKEMFVQATMLFSEDELQQLGDLMQARKDSVQAMWDNPLLRPVKKIQSVAHKLMPTKVKTAKATAIGKGIKAAKKSRSSR